MTPYYADDWLTVYHGDSRTVMAEMPAESVHCVVTSPPYWGLRDYGTASWEGGDPECDHRAGALVSPKSGLRNDGREHVGPYDGEKAVTAGMPYRDRCGKCGAIRQDAQLGLEPTPEQYVASMVEVFREVRRVLRDDGTLWLNLGDSYASGTVGRNDEDEANLRRRFETYGTGRPKAGRGGNAGQTRPLATGLKPKDLVGIPWRVAFALQQPYCTGAIKAETDRAWLAALMDGEGTFTILATVSSSAGSISYPPIAQVRMTSERVVAKAASLVGVASPEQRPPSMRGTRSVYQWRLSGRRAADIGRELYPYLIEKRQQALIAWNHQEVRDSYETKRGVPMPDAARAKQQVCRDLIRRLNHGEHVDTPSWMVEPPSMTEPGWYLRSDVIWAKPNPMPESVTDRPTKAHEYLFLLSKSAKYFYDADAVRESTISHPSGNGFERTERISGGLSGGNPEGWTPRPSKKRGEFAGKTEALPGRNAFRAVVAERNLRSVWTIATQPYPGAHFATFPPKLVEPCIKAGCPEGGTVLDPFAGSGTTGMVAQALSRRAVLIDLSMDYLGQLMERNRQAPLGLGGAA